MTEIKITIVGADVITKALNSAPEQLAQHMKAAGAEAGEEVLNTVGLRQYPPAGPGNSPPYPYYIRGRGTQYSANRNNYRSERLGTQFYIQPGQSYTTVGNRASYARYVVGENQASHMKPIGWRRLIDVAREKETKLTKIFQGWVDRLARVVGL